MATRLENGVNSLIAYYFSSTNFKFLDQHDLKNLINFANISGIQLDVNDNTESLIEIFNQFLADFYNTVGCELQKGDALDCREYEVWNNEINQIETVNRLVIENNNIEFFELFEPFETPKFKSVFDEMMGNDKALLEKVFSDLYTLKKYMIFKKIILCKSAYLYTDLVYFLNCIPSFKMSEDVLDFYAPEGQNGIHPKTYEFINNVEQSALQKSKEVVVKQKQKKLT